MLQFLQKLFGSSTPAITLEDLAQGTVVDVRSPAEYQAGHAEGSINIPLQTIQHNLDKFRKMPGPVVTCCASGNRSGMAAKQLNGAGITAINGGTWRQIANLQA